MGGTALGFQSARLSADDYFSVWERFKKIFGSNVYLIPSYRSKSSFGNMDLLYSRYQDDQKYTTEIIKDCLRAEFSVVDDHYNNGPVTSVGVYVDGVIFQLDFIAVPDDSLNFAYNYFSYNDLGNLIGRLARRVGLKFGHKGLFYVQRDGDYVIKEHRPTNMFSTALYHLGLDAERFYEGFDTLEDIFDYVMSSPYYDFNSFDLSQRNRKARIRDEKRPNYRAFLQYANANPIVRGIKSREEYLYDHFLAFPEFCRDYAEASEHNEKRKAYKAKLNGDIIMKITGLKGKELGSFMSRFKETYEGNTILQMSECEIASAIRVGYATYQQKERI